MNLIALAAAPFLAMGLFALIVGMVIRATTERSGPTDPKDLLATRQAARDLSRASDAIARLNANLENVKRVGLAPVAKKFE